MSENYRYSHYFKQALHDARLAKLKQEYNRRHPVYENYVLPELGEQIDLLVKRKNGKYLLFEVLVRSFTEPRLSPAVKEKIQKLTHYATEHNYEFYTIDVFLPVPPTVKIAWLEEALFKFLKDTDGLDIELDLVKKRFVLQRVTVAPEEVQSLITDDTETSIYTSGELSFQSLSETASCSGQFFLDWSSHRVIKVKHFSWEREFVVQAVQESKA
jgi:hypothetical protein